MSGEGIYPEFKELVLKGGERSGGLDFEVRNAICNIMEGDTEAFRQRYRE